MGNKITALLFLSMVLLFSGACTNDELTPYYKEQTPAKAVIRGYSALADSLQIKADGKIIKFGTKDAFTKKVSIDYDFVFYEEGVKNIEISNKVTKEIIHTYKLTKQNTVDTLSFFVRPNLYVDEVLSEKPGVVTKTGNTGFKFIFPTMNQYSKSGYNGKLDGIMRKVTGEVLGVAKNIGNSGYSDFIEVEASLPPIIRMELVKSGTTESYIKDKKVNVTMLMLANKSGLIVLDEKKNADGAFSNVEGTLNMVDYFDFK
ncbi:hypothetical protein [Flavobacterium gelatinilyticum]|uniref:hypothetical protein n=1 Tax=Flavobacterium gelatinilyticum TaxID=3003260 RepID=UPI0024815E15|nr:hypothetical protein [Flavobacterium gelatinilyticum]